MFEFKSLSIQYKGKKLFVLDQQQLPNTEEWIECCSPTEMHHLIQQLKVRGAPIIAIAAVMALADYVTKGASCESFCEAAEMLKNSRPTAVNLATCVGRLLLKIEASPYPQCIIDEAKEIIDEDVRLCESIANNGQCLINTGDTILTHCNTGGLATAGIGTALGIIIKAYKEGKMIDVFVDETRPLLQGARLTTWELAASSVPYQLICDNMAGALMKEGGIQSIIVGADRIAKNGDVANKIGTYSLAVLARHHNIPFYVAAPYTTIDFNCNSGSDIPIELRETNEVRGYVGAKQPLIWSPKNCDVYNPAFDVTPAKLVTEYILDNGRFQPEDIKHL